MQLSKESGHFSGNSYKLPVHVIDNIIIFSEGVNDIWRRQLWQTWYPIGYCKVGQYCPGHPLDVDVAQT